MMFFSTLKNTEWKCEKKTSNWVAGSTAGGKGKKYLIFFPIFIA